MANPKIRFTYDDYKSLPESECRRYELLDGDLVRLPSPSVAHQRVSGNLSVLLWRFVRQAGLGWIYHAPLDVVLGEGRDREVVQPDILFISRERSEIITHEEIQGAPDLVIEILSPATEDWDRGYKKTLYARHGVREYWIVDPEAQTIEVHTPGEEGFALSAAYQASESARSPILPGLEIGLEEVFGEG